MQFLRVSRKKNWWFFPCGTFLSCVIGESLWRCPNSKKTPPALKNSWLRACNDLSLFLGLYGNKHKHVLIDIFQPFFTLTESFFKSSAESILNRLSVFSNEKYFVCFVIEEIKTSTVDMCHNSVFKLKYSQAFTCRCF